MAFLGSDSLDALRASLLGRQATTDSVGAGELSPVAGELVLGEAGESERHIALLRALLCLGYVAVALLGRAPLSETATSLAWAIAALGLHLALRRGWYRAWVRRLAMASDAIGIVMSTALVGSLTSASADSLLVLTNAAFVATLLVVSGALRMTSFAALSGWLLATVSLVVVGVRADAPAGWIAMEVIGLLLVYRLVTRFTVVVRRVIVAEIGRARMELAVASADARAAAALATAATREEVLRIVAHDLRNPLATLLMTADMLSEPELTAEHRSKFAGVVKRTGARMNTLIRDLLDVARMEGGRYVVAAEPIMPQALVARALELMQPLSAESGITLDTTVRADLPMVSADAARIDQVFSNLIGNAIKFTPSGGRIVLGGELTGDQVWFTVTDTGPGIPAEQVNRIFAPFWQAAKADRRGIGLGLTIAKGIVEAHSGAIGVSSEVGVGTRFWFSLAASRGGH